MSDPGETSERFPVARMWHAKPRLTLMMISSSAHVTHLSWASTRRPEQAPRAGLEPAAYCLGGSRSIRLSYRGLSCQAATSSDPSPGDRHLKLTKPSRYGALARHTAAGAAGLLRRWFPGELPNWPADARQTA